MLESICVVRDANTRVRWLLSAARAAKCRCVDSLVHELQQFFRRDSPALMNASINSVACPRHERVLCTPPHNTVAQALRNEAGERFVFIQNGLRLTIDDGVDPYGSAQNRFMMQSSLCDASRFGRAVSS